MGGGGVAIGGGGFQLTDTKNSSKSFTSQVRTAFLKEINGLGKKFCIYFIFLCFIFSYSDSDSPLQTESVSTTMLARL